MKKESQTRYDRRDNSIDSGVIQMNRKYVQQQIQHYSVSELKEWRAHAVKCLNYYTTYRDDFEIEESQFVIEHIDKRLKELDNKHEI